MKMKQNETLFTNYTNDLFILILLEFKNLPFVYVGGGLKSILQGEKV